MKGTVVAAAAQVVAAPLCPPLPWYPRKLVGAVLIGALMIHNLQLLSRNSSPSTPRSSTLFSSLLCGKRLRPHWGSGARSDQGRPHDQRLLYPLVFAFIGYAVRSSVFDVGSASPSG